MQMKWSREPYGWTLTEQMTITLVDRTDPLGDLNYFHANLLFSFIQINVTAVHVSEKHL